MNVYILPNDSGGWSMYPAVEDGPDYTVNLQCRIGNYPRWESAETDAQTNNFRVVNRREWLSTPDVQYIGSMCQIVPLYNLRRAVGQYPVGATIAAETARTLGLQLPRIPTLP